MIEKSSDEAPRVMTVGQKEHTNGEASPLGMQILVAASTRARLLGLLGRRSERLGNRVLVLVPCSSIHTFGMRVPLDVAFLDNRGKVLRSVRGLAPRRLLSCPHAELVLERVAAGKSQKWLEEGEVCVVGQNPPNGGHIEK